MKILLINKSATDGGAAIAAFRLFEALKEYGIEVNMLVQNTAPEDIGVHSLSNSYLAKKKAFAHFIAERIYFLPFEKDKSVRYRFSPSVSGEDISKHPLVQEADVIHLHWINFGFLSLKDIKHLFNLGKPIVWTLHDMWTFTGGCHYSGDCNNYTKTCGNCNLLKRPNDNDLSHRIYQDKLKIWNNAKLNIVTCSKWLGKLAADSTLLKNKNINPIPNPIDTNIYKPLDVKDCREELKLPIEKKLLLFGAANNDPRKGMSYLFEALNIINNKYPEWRDNLELITFGEVNKEFANNLPFKMHNMKYVHNKSDLIKMYNAADIFVLPSLQDNLPNTMMESLACGTPVVAFKIGGVPEMIISGKTGHLAKPRDSEDLAKGIIKILSHSKQDDFRKQARNFVVNEYSNTIIANRYSDLYKQLLHNQ